MTDRLTAEGYALKSSLLWILAILAAYSTWYIALFSPIIFGGLIFPSDGQLAAFFTPIRMWNPLPLAGMPGVGEPHLAQLYPVRWLFAALPHAIGFNLFVVFSYCLASGLTFGYAFALTRSKLAASIAGLVFGTSGYMIAHLGHTGLFAAVAWMPLTLWALERLRVQFSMNWLAIGALSIAMTIVAGHPQAFAYSIYLGGAYAIFLGRTATHGWVRYVGLYVVIVAIGAAIAAAHILPMLELAELSVRNTLTFDAFKEYALPLKQLPMLLFPYVFGGGYPPTFSPYFGQWNLSEITGYVGLLTLVLSAVGALCSWKRPVGAFWLGTAVISFLLALGDATPLLRVTYYMPVIDKLRAPARHFQEMTLALAVLSALGVEAVRIGTARRPMVARAIVTCGLVLVVNLCVIVLFYDKIAVMAHSTHQMLAPISENPALWMPVAVFALSVVALTVWTSRTGSAPRQCLIIAVLALDLGSNAWFGEWRYGTPTASLEIPKYAQRYRDDLLKTHQRLMPMLGWQEPALAFSPMMSQLYDVPSVGGYGPLLQLRYARLSMVTNGGWINPAVLDPANQAADLLGARYIVAPVATAPVDDQVASKHNLSIALGSGCTVRGNTRQLRLAVPRTVHFDEISIVSAMSCSTNITQDQPVAKLSLVDSEGDTRVEVLRAGKDTSEWAIDCTDVAAVVKHTSATIFENWEATRPDGSKCKGHHFAMSVHVKAGSYKEILIDWLAPASATLDITRITLLDSATNGRYDVRDTDLTFADTARFRYMEDVGASSIFRNERAMPRAWLVPKVVTSTPDEILRAVHTSVAPDGRSYDPYAVAFVEEPVRLQDPGSAHPGAAAVKRLEDDLVEIDTHAAGGTFLVLGDVDYPGWVASIDDVKTHVFRTNYALRGVPVPPGDHTVVFRYRPTSFYIGCAISLAALAALAVLVVGARRKRERAGTADQRGRLVPITTQL